MGAFPFRFDPLRRSLYSPDALFDGFDPNDPKSYGSMHDFRIYEEFVRGGGRTPNEYWMALAQAMHDSSIHAAVAAFLEEHPATVGIMGGHDITRSQPAYAAVARLARSIAREGFTLVSGGGPGAMEATHLGALLAPFDAQVLTDALAELAAAPVLKDTRKIVLRDGTVDGGLVVNAGEWIAPAYRIWQRHRADGGVSLGVPTWFYGSEPATPLATNIAKYFQNSVREDGTLTICSHGIVFVAGAGGTAQEIFQDGCLNYYAEERPAPMIFYDADGTDFWQKEVPAIAALSALLARQSRQGCIVNTSDPATIVETVKAFEPPKTAAAKLAEYRKR